MTRRDWLLTALVSAPALRTFSGPALKSFAIGACDWSLGKQADVAVFDVAKQIGLDGVQLSLNAVNRPDFMQRKAVQDEFLAASRRTGVKIASLAVGTLNEVPYKSDPQTEAWVLDAVDVAKALGVSVILLAFFAKNDLRNDDNGKAEVVRRLRNVAPKAERLGITLGIESYLSAEEHLDIMQRVGSPAVRVYYDPRNATDAGYDVFHEMKLLGRENICEVHIKENGKRLGRGTLDWPRIRQTMTDLGIRGDGWLQIEGATERGDNVVDAYRQNLAFVRNLFT